MYYVYMYVQAACGGAGCEMMYCMFDMYRLLRAQFSSENIESPLVGKITRRGFQRAIVRLLQSSFSPVLYSTRYAAPCTST